MEVAQESALVPVPLAVVLGEQARVLVQVLVWVLAQATALEQFQQHLPVAPQATKKENKNRRQRSQEVA